MTETTVPSIAKSWKSSLPSIDHFMVWIALAALVIVSAIFAPGTLAPTALLAMVPFAAIMVIASIGQCLTIQSGGMDLSVPGSITLAAAVVAGSADRQDGRIASSIILALVAVLIGGILNGLAITKLRVPPIVATLAVNALLVGFVQMYTGGVLKAVPTDLAAIAGGKVLGLPNTFYVAALFVVLASVTLAKTIWGRRLVAVGTQSASARAAGIGVTRYVIGTYAAAALCFGIAGILLAGYLQTPATTMADTYLFSTITAVIIGGTAFGGGRSRIVGTAVGAVFISQLNVFLTATGAPSSITYLVQAAAIAVAVLLNSRDALTDVRRYMSRFGRTRRQLQSVG